MAENNQPTKVKKFHFRPQWILFIIVLGVIVLSVFALRSPVAERSQLLSPTSTPSPVVADVGGTPGEINQTTPQQPPPTVEEIGNTNGIILWSTILVLILLVGTLREILFRNGDKNSR